MVSKEWEKIDGLFQILLKGLIGLPLFFPKEKESLIALCPGFEKEYRRNKVPVPEVFDYPVMVGSTGSLSFGLG